MIPQSFIAEPVGYTPLDFAELLHQNRVKKKVNRVSWSDFVSLNGPESSEIEQLNLNLPIDSSFTSKHSVKEYIENYSPQS